MKKITIIIILFISTLSYSAGFPMLKSLSYSDKNLKRYRNDVRKSIYVIKSRRSEDELPELIFYKYKTQKKDSFWTIASKTSLNIDTLMTINNIDNINSIKTGKTIYLANMRGILYSVKKNDTLETISEKFDVPYKYILKVNNLSILNKKHIFIPCATLNSKQRSAFLNSGYGRPLKNLYVTSSYGNRRDPFHGEIRFHSGIDFRCKPGTPVYSVKPGKVIYSGFSGNYGKLVIIKHDTKYSSYYGHLHRSNVKINQLVKKGQVIGFSGNTGRSTGPHLHFEIRQNGRPVNPKYYLK